MANRGQEWFRSVVTSKLAHPRGQIRLHRERGVGPCRKSSLFNSSSWSLYSHDERPSSPFTALTKSSRNSTSTMSAPSAARLLTQATRTASRSVVRSRKSNAFRLSIIRVAPSAASQSAPRCFSTTHRMRAGLMPDSEDPAPPAIESEPKPTTPTEIDDDEFHLHADQFLNSVHEKAEAIQEGREDVEVDYAVCLA
jgi:hypothetical protein